MRSAGNTRGSSAEISKSGVPKRLENSLLSVALSNNLLSNTAFIMSLEDLLLLLISTRSSLWTNSKFTSVWAMGGNGWFKVIFAFPIGLLWSYNYNIIKNQCLSKFYSSFLHVCEECDLRLKLILGIILRWACRPKLVNHCEKPVKISLGGILRG